MTTALTDSAPAILYRFRRLQIGLLAFLACVLTWMPLEAFPHPVNIARRGGAVEAPENTLATIQNSLDIGVDYIEIDIWLSADDVLVVFHDATVERTTDGTGPIYEKTLAELKTLDAGSWFGPEFAGEQIPTFREAVQLINGHAKILLDPKNYWGPAEDRHKYLPLIAQVLNEEGFSRDETICWTEGEAAAIECRTFLPGADMLFGAWDANAFEEQRIWQRAVAGDIGLIVLFPTATADYVDLVHSYGLTLFVLDCYSQYFATAIAIGVDGLLLANPRSFAALPPRPAPECADGIDNDGDSLVDFPDDIGCFGPEDKHEAAECSDGLDNDGDGHTDYPDDPGCFAAFYPFESPACDDGIDNNNDGLADYPADPGCFSTVDQREGLHCNDGLDNDLDGRFDYPEDTGCDSPGDTSEVGAPAGAMPDGSTILGEQLTVDRADFDELVAMWDDSCAAADDDYALYEGTIGDFESHTPITCGTDGATIWQFAPGEGSRYYLVVPQTSTSEGSYGVDSNSAERPSSTDACGEQVLGPCD